MRRGDRGAELPKAPPGGGLTTTDARGISPRASHQRRWGPKARRNGAAGYPMRSAHAHRVFPSSVSPIASVAYTDRSNAGTVSGPVGRTAVNVSFADTVSVCRIRVSLPAFSGRSWASEGLICSLEASIVQAIPGQVGWVIIEAATESPRGAHIQCIGLFCRSVGDACRIAASVTGRLARQYSSELVPS